MRSASRTILTAGLVAGVLDITAAFAIWGPRGVPLYRILQHIASGLLGAKSFQGGVPTMLLGAALHVFIACTVAATYYFLTRGIAAARRWPAIAGLAYGPIVYAVMNHVVVPLSAVHQRPVSLGNVFEGLAVHVLCIGWPIAFVVARGRRDFAGRPVSGTLGGSSTS